MNHIDVPFLTGEPDLSVSDISDLLDGVEKNGIENVPWPAYPYKPAVNFAIAHNLKGLYLKFYVNENFVQAVYARSNDPVYKDSCVELFISFGEEKEYYNFEFNCAGTCLLGFGDGRADRILLPGELIATIGTHAVLKPATTPDANIGWELTVIIPVAVFRYHRISSFAGRKCRVNFYKCGDALPQPCFLAWNNIETELPDFHVPEFFGTMAFRTPA